MKRTDKANLRHNFRDDQVLYLIGDINYSYLYFSDGIKVLSSRTLKWHSVQWPHFIRIHKNSLINPNQVYSVIRQSRITAHILMKDGVRLQVSRRRVNQVSDLLNENGTATQGVNSDRFFQA